MFNIQGDIIMKNNTKICEDYRGYIDVMSMGEKISTSPLSKAHELSEKILKIYHTSKSKDLADWPGFSRILKNRHETEESFVDLEKKLKNQSSKKFDSKSEMLIKTKKNTLQLYHDVGSYMSHSNRQHIKAIQEFIPMLEGSIEGLNEVHQIDDLKRDSVMQLNKLKEDLRVYMEWLG